MIVDTTGLDPDGIAWLRAFLTRERASGRTLLIATHHLHEAEELTEQCVLLNRTVRYAGPIGASLRDIYHQFR
ncbi:MAG: hypothetical protein JO168_09460 [Solirubrobacterales bacterium]|nr:hypothetical protein [Solirubrobacterales bacterium]MBV9717390.1 hypothetical protein [Solirubrobacterales bacterium]